MPITSTVREQQETMAAKTVQPSIFSEALFANLLDALEESSNRVTDEGQRFTLCKHLMQTENALTFHNLLPDTRPISPIAH